MVNLVPAMAPAAAVFLDRLFEHAGQLKCDRCQETLLLRAVRVNGDGHIGIGIAAERRITRTKCRDYLRHRHSLTDVVAYQLAVVDGGLGIGERDAPVVEGLHELGVLVWGGCDRRWGGGWR
jgi:hypothetical protein